VAGWTLTVVDVTAEPTLSGVAGMEDFSATEMAFYASSYNIDGSDYKTLIADYFWWCRQLLSRR
jgi:hypothetical protein